LIDRIILPLEMRIDADSPTVDARLPDGSRVNAVIPPAAIDGPSITIRKFARERLRIGDLIRNASLTQHMTSFLEACVAARLNVLVSGGTGSGKTTLLNILSEHISEKERIVTIEDAAELQLNQDHTVRLDAQPPGAAGAENAERISSIQTRAADCPAPGGVGGLCYNPSHPLTGAGPCRTNKYSSYGPRCSAPCCVKRAKNRAKASKIPPTSSASLRAHSPHMNTDARRSRCLNWRFSPSASTIL
jgi:hypothetical protein